MCNQKQSWKEKCICSGIALRLNRIDQKQNNLSNQLNLFNSSGAAWICPESSDVDYFVQYYFIAPQPFA